MARTVFWSWQSDLPADITKDFIKSALRHALTKVASELQLESADRIELDHDTKGEAGLVEIVSTIFGKIDECEVFVADITPVAAMSPSGGEKKIPNPNVMIELGYALRELGHKRVITVANLTFGGRPEELPFDLRHRRGAITYSLASKENPAYDKEQKTLITQLAAALKVNLEAPREDRKIKNPLPALALEASEEMPEVALIRQNATLEGIRTLSEIKVETPVKSKADQAKASSALQTPMYVVPFPGMGSRERIKPFREWTQGELDGYNRRVEQYYEQYAAYLDAVKEHSLMLQRAICAKLVLVNRGTRPGTDVRSRLSFPPGVLVYEDDDLPKPPERPSPPPFAPHGIINIATAQYGQSPYMGLLEKPSRIANDHGSIEFMISKLQHHYLSNLSSFTLLLRSENDITSFDADYVITNDESPYPQKGKLRFEVKPSD